MGRASLASSTSQDPRQELAVMVAIGEVFLRRPSGLSESVRGFFCLFCFVFNNRLYFLRAVLGLWKN